MNTAAVGLTKAYARAHWLDTQQEGGDSVWDVSPSLLAHTIEWPAVGRSTFHNVIFDPANEPDTTDTLPPDMALVFVHVPLKGRRLSFCHGGRFFSVRLIEDLLVTRSDTLCEIEYTPLQVHVYDDSEEGAVAELFEEIAFLWDRYGSTPDHALTDAANGVRERLLETVAEVTVE